MSDETMQAAMDQAYRFLAQRFLSSYELTQKMRRKQFEDPIIERVLERLKDYDYINDERLSEQVLAYFMKEQKYGAYMIKQKMKLRGLAIPQEISAWCVHYRLCRRCGGINGVGHCDGGKPGHYAGKHLHDDS